MSKKYYFYFGLSKSEFLNTIVCYLKRENSKMGEIIIRTKYSKIVIQKRIHMRHALQRFFVGKLIYDNNVSCHIEGKFRYPCFNSFLFIMFGIVCLIGNIKMLLSNVYLKYQITAIFSVAYFFVFLMFYTGKRFYKKQEQTVLQMLQYLEEQTEWKL